MLKSAALSLRGASYVNASTTRHAKVLGTFTLSMISVSAIIALRNLPTLAKNGSSIVIILGLAALLFFIPLALSCAELASGWPKNGGVYAWVKEAFGEQSGVLAIWLEWIESVVWLPAVLSFIAASTAYVIDPALAHHRYYMLAVMLVFLWSGTFLNFLGTQTSGWFSTLGIITGSLIPGVAIIVLAAYWLTTGQPTQIEISPTTLIPQFDSLSSLSYFTAIGLSFAGIEVAAFYVQDTRDPKQTFPRATFISASIIIAIYTLGALAIAVVVPHHEMELSAGMMQAMTTFFQFLGIPWATTTFAFLSVVGGLALLNTWIIGPSKGLHASALHGDLPRFTRRTNRRGAPVVILLMQAVIGSALISMNLLIPTMNQFYWIFQTLASQLILMMYFMVFLSVIKLRFTQPHTPRLYHVPGGKLGLWLICGSGACFCLFAFFVGFFPPEEYTFRGEKIYAMILSCGIFLFCAPPFVWHWWQKRLK